MTKNIFSSILRPGRLVVIVTPLVLVFVLLCLTLATNVALASSQSLTSTEKASSLVLQTTPNPTATVELQSSSTFSFSLATLGYDIVTLNSPKGNTGYIFRIPQNWSIQADGVLELDLSYTYNQLNLEDYPALFGNLTVSLDGEPLTIFSVTEQKLERYRLSIALPVSQLADRTQHTIELAFDAGSQCQVPHKAALIIHPTSSILLNYAQQPVDLDLSLYPQPFYLQTFIPDVVRFVLPTKPTAKTATDAVAIAAKLGDLTNNRLVINAMTDVEFSRLLSSTLPTHDDLIVIGKPQDNQLVSLLNNLTELPVSLHRQQLGLMSQGPTAVAPDDTFTYVYTITNTIDEPVNLSLISSLPAYTEFVKCSSNCSEDSPNMSVTWSNKRLEPQKTATLSLTLKATDTLSGTTLENIITVDEADLGPVNADMLTSAIVSDSGQHEMGVSVVGENDYFFTYNGRAVAKEDGIVQEIISPWDENQAILLVTGLSDEAVRKASQAMSSEVRFPGMRGPVALIQDVLPPLAADIEAIPAIDVTLEDLGYPDQVVRGAPGQQVDYFFDIPPGWELTEDASIDLYFLHSQLINYDGSSLTVLLNRNPIVGIPLDETTAVAGHLQVSLANTHIQTSRPNRLTIQATMVLPPSEDCTSSQPDQAWLLVKNNSKIFLPHDENSDLALDMASYPYPFNAPQDLTNLLLALPDTPTVNEWQAALRLAASLGSAAGAQTIIPAATVGNTLSDEERAEYNIIAIGRPTRNILIQEANAQLPQPFLPASDEIEQQLNGVILRLPLGMDLGYIQLIPSPWNAAHAFLALTGTTDESVQQAVSILIGRSSLSGNLVLINGDKVSTIDTHTLTKGGVAAAVATAVPELTPIAPAEVKHKATPIVTPTASLASLEAGSSPARQAPAAQSDRPAWLIPLVSINGLLVIAIVAFAFWRSQQNRV